MPGRGRAAQTGAGETGMSKVVTFGEIMLRLQPPEFERLRQARSLGVVYGGAEANVAISLAIFGVDTEYVTRLPANDLGQACLDHLRAYGVGTAHVLRGGDRLGIYFLERGAAQRGSRVIYDRAGSAFATLKPGEVDWPAVLAGAGWFHWTGITPAVSAEAAAVAGEAVRCARAAGLTVSCDLNYRHNLWKWGQTPAEVMPALVAQCDLVIGSRDTAELMLGLPAAGAGDALAQCRQTAERLAARFPQVSTVASTLRGVRSANHNTWSGTLWRAGQLVAGQTYDIEPVVEQVGGGDAFTAGLIYALRQQPDDPERALRFAIAASCLKHSQPGDCNTATVAEVEQLLAGDGAGRLSR